MIRGYPDFRKPPFVLIDLHGCLIPKLPPCPVLPVFPASKVGCLRPASIDNKVDLPEPFFPTMPTSAMALNVGLPPCRWELDGKKQLPDVEDLLVNARTVF